MPPELKPYQDEGVDFLRSRQNALLADEAGLGKSVQLLKAAAEPVLVVASAMVLESGTWDDEIEKWASGIDATQVSYTSIAQRGTRGKVPRDSNGFPKTPPKREYQKRWGTVILDECHHMKGRKTSYANAVLELNALRTFQATGTPIPNWAQESFMLLRGLYPEEAKPGHEYGSYWRWAKKWFEVEEFFGRREIGDLREDRTWDEFREANWGDRFLRRTWDVVRDQLPPLTMQRWETPMKQEQLRVYRELKKNFIAWTEGGLAVDVWSEPGLLVKLAKMTTGTQIVDPNAPIDGKLKVLQGILHDRPRQTLAVAHFRDSVDAIARVAKLTGKSVGVVRGGIPKAQRVAAIRAFQRGEIDVLAASVNVIAEGMTLHQAGADQIIRVERSATPSKNEQVVRRLWRMGQEREVLCIDLVTPRSYDSGQEKMINEKTDQQMQALGDKDWAAIV